jgi:hypothetical protein
MCFHLDLSWFPFGFGRVTSSYHLLACVPLLNSSLDYLLLCVELCAIICVVDLFTFIYVDPTCYILVIFYMLIDYVLYNDHISCAHMDHIIKSRVSSCLCAFVFKYKI